MQNKTNPTQIQPNPDAIIFIATGQDMSRLDNYRRTGYSRPMTETIKVGSTVKRTDVRGNSADITTHSGVYGEVRYISTPQDGDTDNGYADVLFTLGEMEWSRHVGLEDLEVVHLRKAPTCPACDGTDLRWYVTKGLSEFPGANGLLNISQVKVIGYLSCEECSEVVRLIEVEDIEKMMNSLPR